MVTDDTIRCAASIVWMRPLTSIRSGSGFDARLWRFFDSGFDIPCAEPASSAPPAAAAAAVFMNLRREKLRFFRLSVVISPSSSFFDRHWLGETEAAGQRHCERILAFASCDLDQ